jgi:N-acetylglutamate synthase-like GNAT family acetyltransferase
MPTVRSATPEDNEAIGRVHVRAIRRLCVHHYAPAEIAAWAAPRRPHHYVEAIRQKDFYVVEEAGAVVGFSTLNAAVGEVEAVYVAPEAAGRGLGLQLLRVLEDRARTRGLHALHLNASLNAVPFYERAGYERQGLTKHRLTSGVEIACVLMTKELAAQTNG